MDAIRLVPSNWPLEPMPLSTSHIFQSPTVQVYDPEKLELLATAGLAATAGNLPRISVVTPSFNQGEFLEEAIKSVVEQKYPALEYAVVDGGSRDNSLPVMREYRELLTWCVSESDRGQYDAINKGFAHTSGEIMGWINSDDRYLPWTFSVVSEVMNALPQVEWLTSRFHLFLDERGKVFRGEEHPGFSREQVLSGGTLPGCGWPAWAFIQQEATFWRRSLWERAGAGLNHEAYPLAADFDLWMRFAKEAELYCLDVPLAAFRRHAGQKTGRQMQEYLRQARASFFQNGGVPPGRIKGWCQKTSAKLIRFMQRRHARSCRQQGCQNLVSFGGNGRGWDLSNY